MFVQNDSTKNYMHARLAVRSIDTIADPISSLSPQNGHRRLRQPNQLPSSGYTPTLLA